ncbi:MAG: glycosyltransferase family 2 protein [Deltaproteobacteria bacterium]|nr:glycosyltransferase family 2 protein [Deltaproteobacteria bacterium]
MKICGVIPAFNNESTIDTVVKETKHYIERVIVVDDGSTDKTADIAGDAGAHVIRIPTNRGKGNALRVSFRYALDHDCDAIITLDADLQHDPSEIPKFLEHHRIFQSKIIIGNRLGHKEKIPRVRYVPNRIGTCLYSLLIGQPVEDSQCGFRLYDREIMQNIYILNDGFEAEADVLLRAGKRGYKIGFVPIKTIYFMDGRHRSYYRPVKDTFHISINYLKNLFWKDR